MPLKIHSIDMTLAFRQNPRVDACVVLFVASWFGGPQLPEEQPMIIKLIANGDTSPLGLAAIMGASGMGKYVVLRCFKGAESKVW